jgi:uncharacterized tellurite resistance protein B-like protein
MRGPQPYMLGCDPMEKRVRDMIGGGLRPNDPRRFLVEAMIGAMHADGNVDERELAVLHRQLGEHDLFSGLSQDSARTLVDLAGDAVRFAGSATARVTAIARGLPARVHRLAAYAMAVEVCAADATLAGAEAEFLERLRMAVRVSHHEAQAVFQAAREGHVTQYLDDRMLRVRSLVPVVTELFTLRAYSRGTVTDEHRFAIRDFFLAIPDLTLRVDDLDGELFRAFRKPRPPGFNVYSELLLLQPALPDPVDRYWMAVYAMAAEPPAEVTSWRVLPFAALVQQALQIADGDMDLAVADALAFPANLPRP